MIYSGGGGWNVNVSGADRGTVVYCHGNPESLQIGSKCQLFKQTVWALFTGTCFPPGVDADLGYEGAGSFRWNVRAIMRQEMQRQSRESLFAHFGAKWAVIKAPWCFFNLSTNAQRAFQQDAPVTLTFEHPVSPKNIDGFIYLLLLRSVSHILSYFPNRSVAYYFTPRPFDGFISPLRCWLPVA